MLTMAELYVNERMLPIPEQNLPPKSISRIWPFPSNMMFFRVMSLQGRPELVVHDVELVRDVPLEPDDVGLVKALSVAMQKEI